MSDERSGLLSPSSFSGDVEVLANLACKGPESDLAWRLQLMAVELSKDIVAADLTRASWILARLDQFTSALRQRVESEDAHLWNALSSMEEIARSRMSQLEREASEARRERQAATVKDRILAYIVRVKTSRPVQISQELGLSAPQVSRALRQLENSGHIQSTKAGADGRAVWYEPRGQEGSAPSDHELEKASWARSLARDIAERLGRSDIAAIVRVGDDEFGIGSRAELERIVETGVPDTSFEPEGTTYG